MLHVHEALVSTVWLPAVQEQAPFASDAKPQYQYIKNSDWTKSDMTLHAAGR